MLNIDWKCLKNVWTLNIPECKNCHSAVWQDFRTVLHSSIVVRTQHFVTIVTCYPDYSNLVYHAIVFRMFWYKSGQFLKLSNYFVPNITFIIIDGPVALTENNYGVMKNISTNPFLKSWTNTIIMGCCLVSWFFPKPRQHNILRVAWNIKMRSFLLYSLSIWHFEELK